MKTRSKLLHVIALLVLLISAFPVMSAAAKPKSPKSPKPPKTEKKVVFCHRKGNGGFVRINVSKKASKAHIKHGDGHPGEAVPGQEGMWFDASCKVVEAVHVESPELAFGSQGWGGWSCPAGTTVVGGGYRVTTTPEYPVLVSEAAKPGSASGLYPVYPHYTFTAGETGWVVQNGNTPQTIIVFADCLPTSP
jgi:hypothetical protein